MKWYWVYKHTKDKKGEIEEYSFLQAIFKEEKDAKKFIKEKEWKGVKSDFEFTYFIQEKEDF